MAMRSATANEVRRSSCGPASSDCGPEKDSEAPSGTASATWNATGALAGLPLLIGSCCWPVLVGAMTGIAVSQTSVMLSHTLQFALLLAVFTNLTQHTFYLCYRQRQHKAFQFGPAYTIAASTLFIMVAPTHLVLNVGLHGPGGPGCSMDGNWWLHVCTITGYVLLFLGSLWAADIWEKCFGEDDKEHIV